MHSLEKVEIRVLNALAGNGDVKKKPVRRPRLIPIVVDGGMFWTSPQGFKVQNYYEIFRGKVLIGVEYELLEESSAEKVEIYLDIPKEAA